MGTFTWEGGRPPISLPCMRCAICRWCDHRLQHTMSQQTPTETCGFWHLDLDLKQWEVPLYTHHGCACSGLSDKLSLSALFPRSYREQTNIAEQKPARVGRGARVWENRGALAVIITSHDAPELKYRATGLLPLPCISNTSLVVIYN